MGAAWCLLEPSSSKANKGFVFIFFPLLETAFLVEQIKQHRNQLDRRLDRQLDGQLDGQADRLIGWSTDRPTTTLIDRPVNLINRPINS